MSDFQAGPDWWLASDGKWYPPQSAEVLATVERPWWKKKRFLFPAGTVLLLTPLLSATPSEAPQERTIDLAAAKDEAPLETTTSEVITRTEPTTAPPATAPPTTATPTTLPPTTAAPTPAAPTTTARPTTTAPPPTQPPTTAAPRPASPPTPPPTTAAAVQTQQCTPGYDPCIPPGSDVDCEGGQGNGPRYTGRVTVSGSDPYDLDRDGDGVGCES